MERIENLNRPTINNWKTPVVVSLGALSGLALVAGAIFASSYAGHGIHSMHGTLAGRIALIASFSAGGILLAGAAGVQIFVKKKPSSNEEQLSVEEQRDFIPKILDHFTIDMDKRQLIHTDDWVKAVESIAREKEVSDEDSRLIKGSHAYHTDFTLESFIKEKGISVAVLSINNGEHSVKLFVNGSEQKLHANFEVYPNILMVNSNVVGFIIFKPLELKPDQPAAPVLAPAKTPEEIALEKEFQKIHHEIIVKLSSDAYRNFSPAQKCRTCTHEISRLSKFPPEMTKNLIEQLRAEEKSATDAFYDAFYSNKQ